MLKTFSVEFITNGLIFTVFRKTLKLKAGLSFSKGYKHIVAQ